MTPRERRLVSDLRAMETLAASDDLAFRAHGVPPERYEVMYSVPGLARGPGNEIVVRNVHRCGIYLHHDYPRKPPVITWLTPVFHPNLLPPHRNGGVCIGSWSAAESLGDLCMRLRDLVSYRSLNAADALDAEAAAWAQAHGVTAGADVFAVARFETGADVPVTSRLRHAS